MLIKILVGQLETFDTELGLERSWLVINACMDDSAVVTTLVGGCVCGFKEWWNRMAECERLKLWLIDSSLFINFL